MVQRDLRAKAISTFVPGGNQYETGLKFYQAIGFEVEWKSEGLAQLNRDGCRFLLQNFHSEEMQKNFMMTLEVEDLDAWWGHLQGLNLEQNFPGAKAKAPADYPWGRREIHLIDPAGVCWHIQSPAMEAVDPEALLPRGTASSYFHEIHFAARYRDMPKLKALLAEGVDPNLPNGRSKNGDGGNAPLWFVAQGKWAKDRDGTQIALALLNAGADVNQKGEYGRTALHMACAWANADIVEFLLETGADVCALDIDGNTPRAVAEKGYAEGSASPEERKGIVAIFNNRGISE